MTSSWPCEIIAGIKSSIGCHSLQCGGQTSDAACERVHVPWSHINPSTGCHLSAIMRFSPPANRYMYTYYLLQSMYRLKNSSSVVLSSACSAPSACGIRTVRSYNRPRQMARLHKSPGGCCPCAAGQDICDKSTGHGTAELDEVTAVSSACNVTQHWVAATNNCVKHWTETDRL